MTNDSIYRLSMMKQYGEAIKILLGHRTVYWPQQLKGHIGRICRNVLNHDVTDWATNYRMLGAILTVPASCDYLCTEKEADVRLSRYPLLAII